MFDAHLIRISGLNFDSRESEEKFDKWQAGAYAPMLLSVREEGLDQYIDTGEKPGYPRKIFLGYYANLENFLTYARSAERNAYYNDTLKTWGDKIERLWGVLYQVVRRFESKQSTVNNVNVDHKPSNIQMHERSQRDAPVVLLRGLSLATTQWDKYDNWMREWAYDVYFPCFSKSRALRNTRAAGCPMLMSVILARRRKLEQRKATSTLKTCQSSILKTTKLTAAF